MSLRLLQVRESVRRKHHRGVTLWLMPGFTFGGAEDLMLSLVLTG